MPPLISDALMWGVYTVLALGLGVALFDWIRRVFKSGGRRG